MMLLFLLGSPATPVPMKHMSLVTTAVYIGLRAWMSWQPIKPNQEMIGLMFVLALVNAALAFHYVPGSWFLGVHAIILVSMASAFVSRSWFYSLTVIATGLLGFLGWIHHELNVTAILVMGAAVIVAGLCHENSRQVLSSGAMPQPELDLANPMKAAMAAAHSFEGVAVVNHGIITACNEPFTVLFGWPATETIGRNLIDLLAAGSRTLATESILLGGLRPCEVSCVRKNGTSFQAELFNRILPHPAGNLVITTIRDISDRKRLESELEMARRQLEESHQRQAALSEIDVTDGKLQALQPMLERVVQIATQCLSATGGACLLLWEQSTGLLRLGATTVTKKSLARERVPGFCPGPATQWILENKESLVISKIEADPFGINQVFPGTEIQAYAGIPVLSSGKLLGILFVLEHQPRAYGKAELVFLNGLASKTASVLIILQLIDGQRQANLELEQQRAGLQSTITELIQARETAEAARQAQSVFLTKVIQELRTPLSRMASTTNMLLNSTTSEEQYQSVCALQTSAEMLLHGLNAVNDYSKATAGTLKILTLDFDLDDVLKTTLKGLAGAAEAKRLKLSLHVNDQVPRSLRGDPIRLEQVLHQLLSNAIANTDQGQVTLSVSRHNPSAQRLEVRFEVRDTGMGIPFSDQEQLFKLFARRPNSPLPVTGGLGLGLVLSRLLVSLMGGTIEFKSDPNYGATFWFVIPLEGSSIMTS